MLYCCEVCKATYNTEHDALDCEKRHADEKAKREELTAEEQTRLNKIKESYRKYECLMDKFYEDYNYYPIVFSKLIHSHPINRIFGEFYR